VNGTLLGRIIGYSISGGVPLKEFLFKKPFLEVFLFKGLLLKVFHFQGILLGVISFS